MFRNSYSVPSALGNAYSSVIYDANSIFFNPAILPFLSDYQFISSSGKLFNLSDLQFFNFALQKSFNKFGFGIAYEEFGFNLYKERTYLFSTGYKILNNFSAGANFKILSLSINEVGSKDVLSYDFSLFYQPIYWLNFGFISRNFNEPVLSTPIEKSYQFGFSFSPFKMLLLSFDYELPPYDYNNRFLSGLQFNISDNFIFRCGYQTNPSNISVGLNFNIGKEKKILSLNYTIVYNQIFDYTHIIGLDYKFDNLLIKLSSNNLPEQIKTETIKKVKEQQIEKEETTNEKELNDDEDDEEENEIAEENEESEAKHESNKINELQDKEKISQPTINKKTEIKITKENVIEKIENEKEKQNINEIKNDNTIVEENNVSKQELKEQGNINKEENAETNEGKIKEQEKINEQEEKQTNEKENKINNYSEEENEDNEEINDETEEQEEKELNDDELNEEETESKEESEIEGESENKEETEIKESKKQIKEKPDAGEAKEEITDEALDKAVLTATPQKEKVEIQTTTGAKKFLSLEEIEQLQATKEFTKIAIDISQEGLINQLKLPEPITSEDEIWELYYTGEIKEDDATLLQELFNKPVNINTAKFAELFKLPNISKDEILKIIESREKVGLFESIDDLLLRNIVPQDVFDFIKPFITTIEVEAKFLEYDFNFDETLSDQKTAKIYQNIKLTKNKYQIIARTERDKGETQIDNLLKAGIKIDNFIKNDRLVIGNYGANFGYYQIFNKLKTKDQNVIDIDDNTYEYSNLKGIAYQIKNIFETKFDISILYSKNYYETTDIDTLARTYKISLSSSGNKRNENLEEKLFGGNITFKPSNELILGFTAYDAHYIEKNLLSKFSNKVFGWNFTYLTPLGFILYGENSRVINAGEALLLGLNKKGKKFNIEFNYINNDINFIHYHSYNNISKPDAEVFNIETKYNITNTQIINLRLEEGREKSTDIEYSAKEISWSNKWDNKNSPIDKLKYFNNFALQLKYGEIDYDLNDFSDTAGRYYLESSSRISYFGSKIKTDSFEKKRELNLSTDLKKPFSYNFKYYKSEKNKYSSNKPTNYEKESFEHQIKYNNKDKKYKIETAFKRYYTNTLTEIIQETAYFDYENLSGEEVIEVPTTKGHYDQIILTFEKQFKKSKIKLSYKTRKYINLSSDDYNQLIWLIDFGNIYLNGYYKIYPADENDIIKFAGTVKW
ncbi:MAG TPA: helix-hairpin-helix domain-containing protein [bacterium]|nr:helix-hairpin-helix domain-containing protein [bacterium]